MAWIVPYPLCCFLENFGTLAARHPVVMGAMQLTDNTGNILFQQPANGVKRGAPIG